MEDSTPKNRIRSWIAICFCAFVLLMAAVNVKLAARPALSFLMGEESFKDMTKEIAENYVSSKLWLRSDFINCNGLFARMTGRRAYNQTMLMNNGMLNYGSETFSEAPDETLEINLSDSVLQLSDFLQTKNIPLFFVLAPVKEDLEGELLPKPFHNYQNDTGNHLLELLSDKGVDTLDLRPYVSQNGESSGKYFYRTDHHWNGDGALQGFGILMDELKNRYDPTLDTTYADPDNWNRVILENAFLGTHGKRVGKLYDGLDDVIWYEPDFETDMSLSIPDYSLFFRGSFPEVNVREEYREKQDLIAVPPYVIYIGGDYPSVQHRNMDAPNLKKVLFLKDSFGLAIQAFLSTEFSAVDVIDPRYFTDAGIAEYCEWTRPDLVIMMMSPSAVSNRYYNRVGISAQEREKLQNRSIKTVLDACEIQADGNNVAGSLESIPVKLQTGKSYRVSFEEVSPKDQMPDAISLVLYNKAIESPAQQWIFDTDYYGTKEPWQWTFTVQPNENGEEYDLYLCSGLFGSEGNAAVTIKGFSVTELS